MPIRKSNELAVLCGTLAAGAVACAAAAAPLPTTGLVAQWRSDTGITTDATGVRAWADQAAGDGVNDAVWTGDTSNQAQLATANVGLLSNHPVVRFDGNDVLDFVLPGASSYSGASIFVIGNTGAAKNPFETVVSTGNTESPGVRWGFGMGGDGGQGYGWAGPVSNVNLGNGASISTDTWHEISWVLDTGADQWSVRNEHPTPTAVSNPADSSFFTGAWNGVLGTESRFSPSTYSFGGDVAEILIYNRTVTGGDYAAVHAYLQERYFVVPEPSAFVFAGAAAAPFVLSRRRP